LNVKNVNLYSQNNSRIVELKAFQNNNAAPRADAVTPKIRFLAPAI
jgi:hypothetical protein